MLNQIIKLQNQITSYQKKMKQYAGHEETVEMYQRWIDETQEKMDHLTASMDN